MKRFLKIVALLVLVLLAYSNSISYLPAYLAKAEASINFKKIFKDANRLNFVDSISDQETIIKLTLGSNKMYVNDYIVNIYEAPELSNGSTFIPITVIAKGFGAEVTWVQDTKGIMIVEGDKTIGLLVGSDTAVFNENVVTINPPYLKNGIAMIPIRVFVDGLGAEATWDPVTKIITFKIIGNVFNPKDRWITVKNSENGEISPSGIIKINSDSSLTFAIYPKENYKIKDVLVDGVSIGAIRHYTFDDVTSDHTIEAIFESTIYTINASSDIGGSIFSSGTVTVNYGDSKTFTITPYSGYKISDVKVDGISVGAVSSYTFTNIISDHTISVTFEKEITKTIIILHPDNPYMTVNGEKKEIDPGRGTVPIIIAQWSRTVVPIRAIVEALEGTISWDNIERKVTINFNNTVIELWIDDPKAEVNGTETWIDPNNHGVKPIIVNSRTMLPLRFIAESLGCDVQWDGIARKITILNISNFSESAILTSKNVKYNGKTYHFDFIKINPKDYKIYAIVSPNGLETAVNYADFVKISQPTAMLNGIPFNKDTHDLSGSIISQGKIFYIEAGTKECIGIDENGEPFYEEGNFIVTLTTDKGRSLKTYSVNQKSWGGFTIYTNWYKKDISIPDDYLLLKVDKYGDIVQKIYGAYILSPINPKYLKDGEFYVLAYNFDFNPKEPSIETLKEANSLDVSITINQREVFNLNKSSRVVIQSSPVVVKNGLAFRGEQRYPGDFRMNKYGQRAFLGFDKEGYFYFIVCKTAVSFFKDNVGETLTSLNIFDYVVSLDGGGSTTLYFNGNYLYTPGRDLVNVIVANEY